MALPWLCRSPSVFEDDDVVMQESVLPYDQPALISDISVWELVGCLSTVWAAQP